MDEFQPKTAGQRHGSRCSADLVSLAARARTATPQQLAGLTIIPLLSSGASAKSDLLPLAEALREGSAQVDECGQATVSRLRVRNRAKDRWILGIGGEMVCGGKQDRAINASFLLGPGRTATLPVSCVEQGRWAGERAFDKGGMVSPCSVRTCLEESVSTNVTRVSCVESDQQAVWSTVRRTSARARASSSSGALRRVYERQGKRIGRQARVFARLPDQSGLAVLRGEQLVSIDIFGSPALYAHYHPLLVSAVLADELPAAPAAQGEEAAEHVQSVLRSLGASPVWAEIPPVADGAEIRPSLPGYAVSAVSRDGEVAHISLVCSDEPSLVIVASRAQGRGLGLRICIGEGAPHHARLGPGRIVIGRSRSSDLKIDEEKVSRAHAVLSLSAEGLAVTDLESTNGTWVDGENVDYCRLRVGSQVWLGSNVTIDIVDVVDASDVAGELPRAAEPAQRQLG